MAPRLQLHSLLVEMVEHVYFQPPANVQMQFPCIVYNVDSSQIEHADNYSYRRTRRYQVTVIDRNPDTDLPDKVEELPMCRFDRSFAADDLNHYVFNLFF
jgi:hypothetical protein